MQNYNTSTVNGHPATWVAASPCPICSKTSGWCRQLDDGTLIMCRHVEDGCIKAKEDVNGVPFYLHRPCDSSTGITSGKFTGSAGKPQGPTIRGYTHRPGKGAAPLKVLDRVYSALLSELTLSPEHRQNLRRRGLSDDEIDFRGYRTLPDEGRRYIARKVEDREILLPVPGFVVRHGNLTIAGPAGMLIPCVDDKVRIVALKIRIDNPGDGPKYI